MKNKCLLLSTFCTFQTPSTLSTYSAVVHWSITPLDLWSICPLVHWSIGPLVHWSIGQLDHWTIGPSVSSPLLYWSISPLVHCFFGPMVLWSIGPLDHGTIDPMVQWFKVKCHMSERTSGVSPVILCVFLHTPVLYSSYVDCDPKT